MCAFNTSRLSKIGNLLSLNFYILEASQKRPDVLQDEESVLQKKMKSSKSMLFFTPTNQRRHKSDTAVDHFKPGCKENHFYSLPFGQADASIY